jgi:type IV pilus assembly protein PilE
MKIDSASKRFTYEEGFTLTEMLVVLIIIGILVMLAVPKFTSVINRTKMTEAKLMLNQIYTLEQAFYDEFDHYSKSLDEIGFKQDSLITEAGTARYRIELTATDTTFNVIATSVVDFDRDGQFNVWVIDQNKKLKQEVTD